MNILVTGGAGYLGSVVSSLLLRHNHRVRVLDSLLQGGRALPALLPQGGFEFHHGDIRDAAAVRNALAGIDGVVHLAAIVGDPACAEQPETARAVNYNSSAMLFRAATTAGVRRFVFASTCSNYGQLSDGLAMTDEDTELQPLSLYAETKVSVERMLSEHEASDMACSVLRFATLYGVSGRMRFDLTVNEFTMRMLIERKLVVYGEQFWRPYIHVWDAARAIVRVLESDVPVVRNRIFNVGDTNENYRKSDLVVLLRQQIPGADVEFVHGAPDRRNYRVSFERIRSVLDYSVTRRVPDGIREIAAGLECGIFGDVSSPELYNSGTALRVTPVGR